MEQAGSSIHVAIFPLAGCMTGFTLFPEDSSVLTVEFKLNLLNPAQGDFVEAVGRVVKGGRTLTVCQLDVFSSTVGKRLQVAVGQQTLICVQKRER
jgi:acyl-coenzyme A thioesterase PaaI-like protein